MKFRRLLFFFIFFFLSLKASAQSDTLKVVSWNVFLRPGILRDGQMNRVSHIADYIIGCGADIVVLQEVFHKRARRRMIQKLEGRFNYFTSQGPKSVFGVGSGVMIFSKHPMIEEKFVSYSKSRGADACAKKGVIIVKIRSPQKEIYVAGTHLQAGSYSAAKRVRKSQLSELANAINSISDSSFLILAGDFNITPDDQLFAYLSGSLKVKLPDLSPPLNATANFSDQDLFPVDGKPVWIDYIFLKETQKGKQKKTWIQEIRSIENERFSDHNMVCSIFEINKNSKELYD